MIAANKREDVVAYLDLFEYLYFTKVNVHLFVKLDLNSGLYFFCARP